MNVPAAASVPAPAGPAAQPGRPEDSLRAAELAKVMAETSERIAADLLQRGGPSAGPVAALADRLRRRAVLYRAAADKHLDGAKPADIE